MKRSTVLFLQVLVLFLQDIALAFRINCRSSMGYIKKTAICFAGSKLYFLH